MMPCPESFPVPLIHIAKADSTNGYLNALCEKEKVSELTTVVADFQTAGRGQRGNSWESEYGKNLMFSFVLYPTFLEARKQFLLSQIASLAVKETLDLYIGDVSIKWPNDIYWKDKKICGMLIENDLMGIHISQSIAGVGININQKEFHSSAPNPISIIQIIAEHTRSLSANGSINFPKFVTRLYFLAIFPSNMSVRLATQNKMSAIHLFAGPPTSVNIKNTKNGTMITLNTVSLFGKFICQSSYQIIFFCSCHCYFCEIT